MLPRSPKHTQPNLFYGQLRDMLDSNDPLIALADASDWDIFEESFAQYYSDEGRPAKPIRLMVGLLILKQLEDLSDEKVVLQWKRNPYYQYFCGMREYQPSLPCDPTDLVYFRRRIGKEEAEKIFAMSVGLHGKEAEEKQVIVTHANTHRTKPIEEAICDRGYRGKKEVEGVTICIPGTPLKRDTTYQKEQKRKKFKNRAAIEPVIGHLKSDHRLSRNCLKGFIGDEINLLLAAAAFNLKKWMNRFWGFLFIYKVLLLAAVLIQIKPEKRRKYVGLYLMFYRVW